MKNSLKPCSKAATSWGTTAWKHKLGATEAGGAQVNKQQQGHPGGNHSKTKQQALTAGQDHRAGAERPRPHSCPAA